MLKKLAVLGLVLLLLFIFYFVNFTYAKAFAPFGGPILAVIPPIPFFCWSVSYVIGPPVSSYVVLVPGSGVFPFYSLHPGAWVVGTALPPTAACPAALTIAIVGTSE